MYNVADLPAVRAQAAAAKAEGAALPSATESTQLPSQEKQSTISPKPVLAFDKGRYYVVDDKK